MVISPAETWSTTVVYLSFLPVGIGKWGVTINSRNLGFWNRYICRAQQMIRLFMRCISIFYEYSFFKSRLCHTLSTPSQVLKYKILNCLIIFFIDNTIVILSTHFVAAHRTLDWNQAALPCCHRADSLWRWRHVAWPVRPTLGDLMGPCFAKQFERYTSTA
jgi:hypothetical protein